MMYINKEIQSEFIQNMFHQKRQLSLIFQVIKFITLKEEIWFFWNDPFTKSSSIPWKELNLSRKNRLRESEQSEIEMHGESGG